jgi:hypothetical protein
MLRQILDDDARFRHGPIPRLVAQHGDLADRPELLVRRIGLLVEEVDDMRLELRVVLIEGDQRLLAERRKWMEMQRE